MSLVEKGVFVNSYEFWSGVFSCKKSLHEIVEINPDAIMFGTDLSTTRAPRFYFDNDFFVVVVTLGEDLARKVFYNNAVNLYRPASIAAEQAVKG